MLVTLLLFSSLFGASATRLKNFTINSTFVNSSDADFDLGPNKGTFSFPKDSISGLKVGHQNVSFNNGAHIGQLRLDDDADVRISNRSSFDHVKVSKNSTLRCKKCDISCSSVINVDGKFDIEDSVTLSSGTLVMAPGSSFTNSGTIVLTNTSQVVVAQNATISLNNNIRSSSTDTSLVIEGTVKISQNSSILVEAPIFVNSSAQLVVQSYSSLTVSDVTTQGAIQVEPYAMLFVIPNSTVLVDTPPSVPASRKLLQVSNPGTCLFDQAILAGSGLLDCNVIFSGIIDGMQSPSVLEVASLIIDSSSKVLLDATNSIISRNNIQIGGELVVDLSGGASGLNYTLMYSSYGTVSGTFSKQTFLGTSQQYSVVYTPDSVNLVVSDPSPEQGSSDNTKIIVPIVVVLGCVVSVVAIVKVSVYRRNRRMANMRSGDIEHAYMNPLATQ